MYIDHGHQKERRTKMVHPKNLTSFPSWMNILYYIYENKGTNLTEVAKGIDITYCHLHKVFCMMQKNGWVKVKRYGRINEIILTDTGMDIAEHIFLMKRIINKEGSDRLKIEEVKEDDGEDILIGTPIDLTPEEISDARYIDEAEKD